MTLLQILLLALVQGAAELLPISSSAHVVVTEKLLGIDPTSPEATLLLVMLHTGTMLAVILYFWRSWHKAWFSSGVSLRRSAILLVLATAVTGVVGLGVIRAAQKLLLSGHEKQEIEMLFGNLEVIGTALAVGGILILYSGLRCRKSAEGHEVGVADAGRIGAIQGLCLPFRGFSRSGATISMGMLCGVSRRRAEEFSFALAVLLTPPVIIHEVRRLMAAQTGAGAGHAFGPLMLSSLFGLVCSFLAGLLALWLLSRWLEKGRWYVFGVYGLVASAAVFILSFLER